MPWHIEDDNADCDGFAVVKDSNGEVVGCHKTKKDAEDHLAALYANVEESRVSNASQIKTRSGMGIYRASFRASDLRVKMAADGAPSTIEGYATLFGVPNLVGDIVDAEAFTDSLAAWRESGDPIPLAWSHEWTPFGIIGWADPNDVVADETGLKFKATLDDSDLAQRVGFLVKNRLVREMSFSADIVAAKGATLTKLDLIEFGPTLKGLMPGTSTEVIAAALEGLVQNTGRRNAQNDLERMQSIHNLLVELGVTCEPVSDEESDEPTEEEALEPTGGNSAEEDLLVRAENAWLDAKLFSHLAKDN